MTDDAFRQQRAVDVRRSQWSGCQDRREKLRQLPFAVGQALDVGRPIRLELDRRKKYSVSGTDNRLSILLRIPGKCDARREDLFRGTDGRGSNIEFVAQAGVQSQIRSWLPCVFEVRRIVRGVRIDDTAAES